MRVALFSPFPPSRSGIADYSQALAGELKRIVELESFDRAQPGFDPARFDIVLYQIGNNPHHDFVYQTALRHPGVAVMHEANLHHLLAELTIKRGDWEGYLRECEYEGGPEALVHARRVRALEVGPDYEGLPMLRRLLEASRGLVVHSAYTEAEMRAAGFGGPVGRIPHGAWIPEVDGQEYRHRLGLDETTPLAGIFGFLKPYKRIAESLRAFRRLVRVAPNARLILVGEPHPELPLDSLIRSLDLGEHVRVLGFAPIEDFVGCLAACDIVLNLRYPTVGESSGSLLRALGLGKAVLVSDVGSFREYPDEICLKVPVGPGEEDLVFEYLNLLVSRRDVARALGGAARKYVEQECNWQTVACRYASFLHAVVQGTGWQPPAPAAAPAAPLPAEPPQESAGYLRGWASEREARAYVETHVSRLARTLEITPRGGPGDRVLEMGAYLQITPALRSRLGYGEVRGCYYGPAGRVDHRSVVSEEGERFECDIDLFDAERDPFPYPDGHFSTVLCCELIEHLAGDPMHLMAEVNRILRPEGHLVLTTPNIASLRGLSAILQGYHPGFFHAYIRPTAHGKADPRHNREYTPVEIHRLLENAGFTVVLLETGAFREEPHPEYGWVVHLLERYGLPADLRGEGIYAVGRKTGAVRERYPEWLYG
jgi:glycosyltransferase involved in cell wall biosynthesis/SAM-dependent methyltransferase